MDQPKAARPVSGRPGFALIATLTLMILLAILAVGLLSLSSVALRSSSQGSDQAEARANARMALMMALGQLQQNLGPDARISARAETLAKDARVGASVPPNTPEAWWVGVSHSDGSTLLPGGKPVTWLVSGAGGSPLASLPNPVKMIGAGSLDLAATTGGSDIEAGRVELRNPSNQVTGSYAWFVDDNGMKAKLNASPELRNEDGANGSGGVLPASYDPSILEEMDVIADATREEIQRLGSLPDLEFLGASRDVARGKFFGYTARSLGVLADVKNGGLKKDLSVAFDWQPTANSASNPVFDRLFPRTGSVPSHFIAADRNRLASPELGELNRDNGYINFAIFRDYYRLKDHLVKVNGVDCLWPTGIIRNSLIAGNTSGVYQGNFGPHPQSSWNTVDAARHSGLPYGNYPVNPDAAIYRDNPILPILAFAQQNAWVTQQSPTQIRTHVQLFTSHYNAHNAGILISPGTSTDIGPRLSNIPQVRITVSGTTISDESGLNPSQLEVHAPNMQFLQPGRAQVLGFGQSAVVSGANDGKLYSRNIAQIVVESVYKDHSATLAPDSKLTAVFHLTNSNFVQGIKLAGNTNNQEVSQVFHAPFVGQTVTNAKDAKPNQGTTLTGIGTQKTVATQGTGLNHVARNAFYLRTTREPDNAIRPLVDANIRAMWNNPRWDAPLGLSMLAAHSETSNIAPSQNLPLMATAANGDGFTYWGSDRDPSGFDRVVLFDVPRSDLVSLGQLQHAAAGRFSYEPTYIVGNSYANLRIPLDSVVGSVSDTVFCTPRNLPAIGSFNLYDASFIVNERLWDEYIFTTIPQSGGPSLTPAYCESLLSRDEFLLNPRFIPYEPLGSTFSAATLSDAGTGDGLTGTGSFFHNAGHLLVDGAFNINSTSIDAWEAFLSSTHRLPVGKMDNNGSVDGFTQTQDVRFPRAASHLGAGMKTNGLDENYWIGFRELTQTEVRELAAEIVAQIRKRGPFLNLGSFVNRKLGNSEEGKSGALQAALDNTVNRNLDPSFQSAANHNNIPANGSQGSGFPGQLLQGDVLQALSPYMTVRSDTFNIRAYGEAKNPTTGAITATAYCEAVVQRFPDPVDGSSNLVELARPSSPFGRRFSIISFRWLSPSEV